jgi:hypothetical protein
MPSNLPTIKAKLERANIDYGVAVQTYDELMAEIEKQFGITTVTEAGNEMEKILSEIPKDENRRDAMLAKAESILQNTTMEDSNGTTKEVNIQGRRAHTTNNTMAQNRTRTVGRPQKREIRG